MMNDDDNAMIPFQVNLMLPMPVQISSRILLDTYDLSSIRKPIAGKIIFCNSNIRVCTVVSLLKSEQ